MLFHFDCVDAAFRKILSERFEHFHARAVVVWRCEYVDTIYVQHADSVFSTATDMSAVLLRIDIEVDTGKYEWKFVIAP